MSENKSVLHLLAGKICAGKSSLAIRLGRLPRTIIVSEDQWLSGLYKEQMNTVSDYVRYSARLSAVLEPHLVLLLKSGLSVVLDFPANTLANRAWMRGIFEKAECSHRLHYLNISDDVCKARLQVRNASGAHEFAATDEQFSLITSHFVAPATEEGFNIVVHDEHSHVDDL